MPVQNIRIVWGGNEEQVKAGFLIGFWRWSFPASCLSKVNIINPAIRIFFCHTPVKMRGKFTLHSFQPYAIFRDYQINTASIIGHRQKDIIAFARKVAYGLSKSNITFSSQSHLGWIIHNLNQFVKRLRRGANESGPEGDPAW